MESTASYVDERADHPSGHLRDARVYRSWRFEEELAPGAVAVAIRRGSLGTRDKRCAATANGLSTRDDQMEVAPGIGLSEPPLPPEDAAEPSR
jgi:hypothetical protein